MRLKRYIFFSFLLMVLVGGIVYSQIDHNYTFNILGIPVTLPVAVWIVIPMFIMFLASFFHMAYYSFINFMKLKRYKKDYSVIVDSLAHSLIREPRSHQYRTQEAQNIGEVSDHSHIIPQDFKIATKEEKLKRVLEYVKDIQNGIYVEIEEYQLSPKNPLLIKNIYNRLKEEPTYSGVVLKNCQEFPQDLCEEALLIYMSFSDISKIKDYAKVFTFNTLLSLIQIAEKNQMELHYQDILYILQESGMKIDEKGYIQLAMRVKKVLPPDDRLKLFGILKDLDEKSEGAYVYTLLDLEMLDKAREFLETTGENELLEFKAYLDLKRCKRDYPLELFLR